MHQKTTIDTLVKEYDIKIFLFYVYLSILSIIFALIFDVMLSEVWRNDVLSLTDYIFSRPRKEFELANKLNQAAAFSGAVLIAHLVMPLSMPITGAWFACKVRSNADFSNPRNFMLRPESLILLPVYLALCVLLISYNGMDGSTSISQIIYGTPLILVWIPATYAASLTIICKNLASFICWISK